MIRVLAISAILGAGGCGVFSKGARDELALAAVRALTKAIDDIDTDTAVCIELPELSDGEYVYVLCRGSAHGGSDAE